ncbi:MAG: hypothetical protein J1E16_08405 [Muribaculaceae bacterium]|nr:hypothetical protein [Muribaculaceae bacterium]
MKKFLLFTFLFAYSFSLPVFSAEEYATSQSISSRGNDYDELIHFIQQVQEEIDRTRYILIEETPDVAEYFFEYIEKMQIELIKVYEIVEIENEQGTFDENVYAEVYLILEDIIHNLRYIMDAAYEAQDQFENQVEENQMKYQEDREKIDKLYFMFEDALIEIKENYENFDYLPFAEEIEYFLRYLRDNVEIEWEKVNVEGGEYQTQITDEDFDKFEYLIHEMFMAAEDAGVDAILDTVKTPAKIYSLDGNYLKTLNKGINILIYPDGTKKKIMVK